MKAKRSALLREGLQEKAIGPAAAKAMGDGFGDGSLPGPQDALVRTLCRLLQILAGVAALLLCTAIYALAGFLDIWNRLWRVAFH